MADSDLVIRPTVDSSDIRNIVTRMTRAFDNASRHIENILGTSVSRGVAKGTKGIRKAFGKVGAFGAGAITGGLLTQLSLDPAAAIAQTRDILGGASEEYAATRIAGGKQGELQALTRQFGMPIEDMADFVKEFGIKQSEALTGENPLLAEFLPTKAGTVTDTAMLLKQLGEQYREAERTGDTAAMSMISRQLDEIGGDIGTKLLSRISEFKGIDVTKADVNQAETVENLFKKNEELRRRDLESQQKVREAQLENLKGNRDMLKDISDTNRIAQERIIAGSAALIKTGKIIDDVFAKIHEIIVNSKLLEIFPQLLKDITTLIAKALAWFNTQDPEPEENTYELGFNETNPYGLMFKTDRIR